MGQLFINIRQAIDEDRFAVTDHADNRLRERSIPLWQVLAGLADAKLVAERRSARPNPCIELDQSLPDGTSVKVVWAWIGTLGLASLVTVHFIEN